MTRSELSVIGLVALVGLSALLTGSCGEGSVPVETAPGLSIETIALSVEGMTCGGCSLGVRQALKSVDGVVAAEVSYDDQRADVRYQPRLVRPSAMVAAIAAAGFSAVVMEDDDGGS